jgi:hypothetical protein
VVKLIFYIALALAPFAGAIAFIITYQEYAKHLVDKKRVLKVSLRAALVAFLFFLLVPTLLIWLFFVVLGMKF